MYIVKQVLKNYVIKELKSNPKCYVLVKFDVAKELYIFSNCVKLVLCDHKNS